MTVITIATYRNLMSAEAAKTRLECSALSWAGPPAMEGRRMRFQGSFFSRDPSRFWPGCGFPMAA